MPSSFMLPVEPPSPACRRGRRGRLCVPPSRCPPLAARVAPRSLLFAPPSAARTLHPMASLATTQMRAVPFFVVDELPSELLAQLGERLKSVNAETGVDLDFDAVMEGKYTHRASGAAGAARRRCAAAADMYWNAERVELRVELDWALADKIPWWRKRMVSSLGTLARRSASSSASATTLPAADRDLQAFQGGGRRVPRAEHSLSRR